MFNGDALASVNRMVVGILEIVESCRHSAIGSSRGIANSQSKDAKLGVRNSRRDKKNDADKSSKHTDLSEKAGLVLKLEIGLNSIFH